MLWRVGAMRRATDSARAHSGNAEGNPLLTEAEVRAALADVVAIKRALRQHEANAAWQALRALEMKLGRGLRAEKKWEQHAAAN